jgi:threonylcarbamoyladenosine tRNA methylthiotransferase CDKAL1
LKVYLESYGCTLNHGEARYLQGLLRTAGHETVVEPEEADICVLFTCTVIKTTELKMLRRTRYFSDLGKPLIVSGCMAVVQRKAIHNVYPGAYFLPPKEIKNVNNLLEQISERSGAIVTPGSVMGTGKICPAEKVLTEASAVLYDPGYLEGSMGESIDSIVPISTGCRGRCTYCITRLARGELTSYSDEKILNNVITAVRAGRYEIRLTAQDTACYGYDSKGNLARLLSHIVGIKPEHEFRVRVGMMNPESVMPILDELIESYRHRRIFKFLHLPVQSGDDELLKTMCRNYSVADFLSIVDSYRGTFPGLTISTDIIVGYPGERDEQFRHSMELIERLRPNIVNITRFSARLGTPAASLKNTLPGSTVKARSRAMTVLRFEISKELNEREVGKKYYILVTERVKAGSVLGRTDNYQPVVIKDSLPLGSWSKVSITGATDSYLVGKLEK